MEYNKALLFIHSLCNVRYSTPHIKKNKRNLCYMCVLKDNVTGNKADKFTSILLLERFLPFKWLKVKEKISL